MQGNASPQTASPDRAARATARWRAQIEAAVAQRPVPGHRPGLDAARGAVVEQLERLGFTVEHHRRGSAPPVIVARRPGAGLTVGLAGHYDIELAGEGWSHPPFEVTAADGRLFGRGLADNLGPLWLRLATLEQRVDPWPSLLWVLQGEEETGSAAAHALYPTLDLPPVDVWLEETGYFEADGTQRLLAMHLDETARALVDRLVAVAADDGRAVEVHARYLNKAFGQHRCPFLTHLVQGRPYLAIGPNDPASQIHAPDESLPLDTLAVSVRQFDALLTAAARMPAEAR